jgi:hypothetical protein
VWIKVLRKSPSVIDRWLFWGGSRRGVACRVASVPQRARTSPASCALYTTCSSRNWSMGQNSAAADCATRGDQAQEGDGKQMTALTAKKRRGWFLIMAQPAGAEAIVFGNGALRLAAPLPEPPMNTTGRGFRKTMIRTRDICYA